MNSKEHLQDFLRNRKLFQERLELIHDLSSTDTHCWDVTCEDLETGEEPTFEITWKVRGCSRGCCADESRSESFSTELLYCPESELRETFEKLRLQKELDRERERVESERKAAQARLAKAEEKLRTAADSAAREHEAARKALEALGG